MRGVFLPARDWQIEDTWYVAGLKGTGSHHIALKDTVVSEANFFDLANGVPCLPGPLYQAVPQLLPLMHGAISVGIAESALDELVELANTGRQQLQAPVPMRDSETFQGERTRRSTRRARRPRYGSRLPASVPRTRASRSAAAARSMKPHRCNGGCATCTQLRNTSLRSPDNT